MAKDIVWSQQEQGGPCRGGHAARLLLRLLLLLPAPAAATYQHKLMFQTPFAFIIKRNWAAATAMGPGGARFGQLPEEPRREQCSAQRSSGDTALRAQLGFCRGPKRECRWVVECTWVTLLQQFEIMFWRASLQFYTRPVLLQLCMRVFRWNVRFTAGSLARLTFVSHKMKLRSKTYFLF